MAESSLLNSNQLEKAFTETGGPGVRRERVRKANRKQQFLNDLIVFKIVDERGDNVPGCVFKITRKRVTRENLQDVVDQCPHPVLIDYLVDNTGKVIWMEDIQLQAEPAPAEYTIIAVILREPFDICRDPHYDGQTAFILQYV